MLVINIRIIYSIILHISTIIFNKRKDIINNITIFYQVFNKIIFKNLNINNLMVRINMYKNKNLQKILSSLNLIIVFIQINIIKLKISSKEYKHKKLLMVILKILKYKILR
jgi:hypothetical protein